MAAPMMVYGIQMADPEMAGLVKKVLNVSFVMAGIAVINSGYRFTNQEPGANQTQSILLGLALALLIPLCGYVAAKNSDSNMACCFCGWNLVGAICNVLAMVTIFGLASAAQASDDPDLKSQAVTVAAITAVCSIPQCILQVLGFWWGNELRTRIQAPIVVVQPGAAVAGVGVQPGMMQPGMMQPGMMQPGMMQAEMTQPGMQQPGVQA